ncbi:hypothetical protein [Dyella choica]|uniref:Phage baseplate protein n=1 Tax=Dyella choica TaxID=1927959 RepID=A0A3S0PR08_9GAMM|nr:hypothetical protein [Dyella choica]RUL78936.1 hypothetical protein EKH80_03810 [Dyella choica]
MRTPAASDLLQAWERGGDYGAAARSLVLLRLCSDEPDDDVLAQLPLGRRDALLLQLYARLFGRQLDGVAQCPACHARVEIGFDADALRVAQTSNVGIQELFIPGESVQIRFRAVDVSDLLALQFCTDAADARRQLLQRCVIELSKDGVMAPVDSLSGSAQATLAEAMAEADPQADLQLVLSCPDCAHNWSPLFDIGRFLWQQLHAWALRLLRDVDTLARNYHWSEAEILAMTPRRRQAYLEQCVS